MKRLGSLSLAPAALAALLLAAAMQAGCQPNGAV